MKIYKDVNQKSEEWMELRKLKMTASKATAIGNNGKGLETYITELMADYFSTAEKESFSNEHTERGNELEEQARQIYELEKRVKVDTVGFIEANEHLGCSPDGLVGDDGILEIKCLNDVAHYAKIRDKKADSGYIWQVQLQMLITGRKWTDLAYYNPNFKHSLIIFRIEPDEKKFEKLRLGIENGLAMIKTQLLNYEI